jgi:hypothetical protein
MLNLLSNIPRKTKLILAFLGGLVIILTLVVILKPPSEKILPQKVSPLLKSEIGITTQDELEEHLNIINKEASAEGTTRYTFDSNNPLRPDLIITQNNAVKFERVYIPENPKDPGYLKISDLTQRYGQTKIVKKGSKLWGPHVSTFIYAEQGIAFLGNLFTGEVYELQQFEPTTADDYIKKYGDDITGGEIPKENL